MLNRNNKLSQALGLLFLLLAAPLSEAAQGWLTLTPTGEGFSVQLPSKPKEEASQAPILGDNYLMKMYTVVGDPKNVLYMAVMQELPAVVAGMKPATRLDEFINGFRSGFLKELTATCPEVDLKLEKELTLKDRTGRQYSFNCRNTYGLVRVYYNERRMYVLLAMAKDEKDANVMKFLQSFEILPAPVPVVLPKTEPKPSQDQ